MTYFLSHTKGVALWRSIGNKVSPLRPHSNIFGIATAESRILSYFFDISINTYPLLPLLFFDIGALPKFPILYCDLEQCKAKGSANGARYIMSYYPGQGQQHSYPPQGQGYGPPPPQYGYGPPPGPGYGPPPLQNYGPPPGQLQNGYP